MESFRIKISWRFGESRKNDNYPSFAAYPSGEFVKFLCEKYLPDRNQEEV